MHLHVRRPLCQFEQGIVQFSAAKPSSQAGESADLWEAALHNAVSEVIANALERCARPCVQAEPFYRCDACRHETFAAGLFPWKVRTLKQLDRKAQSAEVDR
jgi:hypothetical protein